MSTKTFSFSARLSSGRFLFLAPALLLGACELPAAGVVSGMWKPETWEADGHRIVAARRPAPGEAARPALDLLRDPRCRGATRSRDELLTELQGLESRLGSTPEGAPARAEIVTKLADDYAELSCVARQQQQEWAAKHPARAQGNDPFVHVIQSPDPEANPEAERQLAKAEAIDRAATEAATRYNAMLALKHGFRCGQQAQSLRGARCTDALAYYVGYGAERMGDLDRAQRAYLEVVQNHRRSPFVPYAYFAFGELFLEEASRDPSKQTFEKQSYAEQSYREVLRRGMSENDLYAYALMRLGTMPLHVGQQDQGELLDLTWLAHRDPNGPAATALQMVPKKIAVGFTWWISEPHLLFADARGEWIAMLEKQCERGHAQSCMYLGDTLSRVGGPADRDRMLALYTNACDGGMAVACFHQGTIVAVSRDDARTAALFDKACHGDVAAACANLGTMALQGRGVARDEARALDLFIKACDGGFAPACSYAGDYFEMAVGVAQDPMRASPFYERGCDQQHWEAWRSTAPKPSARIVLDPSACIRLGRMFEGGSITHNRGARQDELRAWAEYGKACSDKVTDGCAALGRLLESSTTLRNEAQAASEYGKGCDDNRPDACRRLGVLFEQGRGVGKDEARAAVLYKKGCDIIADGEACHRYAQFLEQGRAVDKDEARAAVYFTRACDAGDARGCYQIGRLFTKGTDPEKDAATAAAEYRKSCDGGDAESCFNLGLLVASGFGVAAEEARADTLFTKACDKGHARACFIRGLRFNHGRGWIGPSPKHAVPFHIKACDFGELQGCFYLGIMYADGVGILKDEARGAELLTKACVGDIATACSFLGTLYMDGRGVSKDAKLAKTEFERACALGHDPSCTPAKQ